MISLPGLTLATGRHDVALRILRTFARFVSQGMLPNVFPGVGEIPDYNTADASLWFFEAWRTYVATTGDMAALRMAFPVLADATRYAVGALKHSLHSCYFCYHLKTAPLNEEVEFFNSHLGRSRTLLELLNQRQEYHRSFTFVLRCVPILFQLHLRTVWDNRFPRAVARGRLSG